VISNSGSLSTSMGGGGGCDRFGIVFGVAGSSCETLLRPCLTPGLIRSLRSHRSSTAQLRSRITYSGHGHADIPPLSTTLGLVPTQSLLHLTVYPALT